MKIQMLLKRRACALTLLAVGLACEVEGADTLRLATRGEATACTIVLPAQASESQRYAAAELQDYVKRMTGVALSVKTDAEALPSRAVLIGETKYTGAALGGATGVKDLGDDGFRLVAKGPHLLVLGSSVRGCLYGVYELLEKYGGCRWYASWHTVVPQKAAFEVPADLDVTQKPHYVMRTSWWWDVNAHNDFAARLRVNSRPWGVMEKKYGGDAFRFCRNLQSCHTFDFLIPPWKYRKDHPEYFSRSGGSQTQPCLTHPDVLAIVTSNVLEQIRLDPEATVYGVSQNDWQNYCTCPRCKAVDEEEGSHAGTMVRFVNAIAEAVEKKYPGKIIETLAYQYTRRPPTKTKLRHNVVPCLCSIECDFGRSIPESSFHQNKSFMKDIEGWSPMTDQLYVWDYVTNFRHYPYPLPNCYALQGNLRFFLKNKTKEMFPEGDYQGQLADFDVLKAWLLAKWQWNVDLPMKDLLDDFFAGYYGKAAPFVRAYFEELHRVHCADPAKPRLIYEGVQDPGALPDDFLARAAKLFDQALAAVKDEPAVFGRNVRGTAFSVDYTRFLRLEGKGRRLLWLCKAPPEAKVLEEGTALARRMLPVMEEFKPVRLSEDLKQHERELALIRAAAARTSMTADLPVPVTCGCVEEKDLNYVRTAEMGAFVDDPQAEDGRALKLFNNHFEWSTMFRLSSIAYDPGQRLRLRVRCRVDRKPGAKGEAIWMGVWDEGARRGAADLYVQAENLTTDGYVWYDVGVFTPNDAQFIWIGPGRFDQDGKSRINALYVDKIELSIAK